MKSNTTAAERGAMLAKHVTSQRQKQSGMVKIDKPNRQQRRAAKRATPKVAVATPDVAPADLPEPDFTLDGGSTRCYYESTVNRLLATRPAEGVPAQDDAARLDWMIGQRAYVVSDAACCDGYWLHWAKPDGSVWVQGDEYATPRAAIDAAMAQDKEGKP